MTRKDYVLLADALRRVRNDSDNAQALQGIDRAAREIANALGSQNRAFDRERFLRAAGVIQ